ncbi:MAG: HlyD family efflux transporter periplasmic adaptor subunit [Methylobacteriaceae bacterium]|nr:HlyD family efflux transporter periplasmic adaptor subunit [Methylobacteriaceae bacterium]MBV9702162.1 HlyD family efflux transporter periplasmic adaptor subunit [Methylobacteriaceae bacterium]
MGRRTLIILVALLAIGAVAWWQFADQPDPVRWQGYAEADYVKVGPTQQGLLVELDVGRGDEVVEGQPLFAQDEVGDRALRDQARNQVAQAEAQLANLEAPGKDTEIKQAEANLADARATRDRDLADLQRAETLMKSGNTTAQNIDQLRAQANSAIAKVAMAEANLAQVRSAMGRPTEIEMQKAAVSAARAALAQAEWRLAQRRVTAPIGGRIADTLARPGETIAAGAPVVSLLPPQNILVRFFVPEPALASLHRGDRVALGCDGCPADLDATVSFVSPQSEYTPPVIYSESTRAKLIFLIEARPNPEQANLLKPGQPVDVRPLGKPQS